MISTVNGAPFSFRAPKSCRTLNIQSKVRINVILVQYPICYSVCDIQKKLLFNSFLLYCSDNCSKTHPLSHFSN